MKNIKIWHVLLIGLGIYLLWDWYKKRQNSMPLIPGLANGGSNGSIKTENSIDPMSRGIGDRSTMLLKPATMTPLRTGIGEVYVGLGDTKADDEAKKNCIYSGGSWNPQSKTCHKMYSF